MIQVITSILTGPIVDAVIGVFKSYQSRKISEAELRTQLNSAILVAFAEATKTQGDVIKAEANAEGWLQRNWRPMTAVAFASIVFFYGIVLPIAVGWFGAPPARVGDDLLKWIMDAVVVCLGGYIGGRSLEKIVETLKK